MTVSIGVVGNDVPRQLVMASGGIARRLGGAWDGPIDERAAALLGAVDPVVAGVLTDLLGGRQSEVDGLIVCNDSQSHLRLFYILRMLQGEGLPRVHLLDLPRVESEGARRFATLQFDALVQFCAGVSGTAPTPEALRSAGSREAQVRTAVDRLQGRRRATSPVRGGDALSAMLAAGALEPEAAVAALDAVREEAPKDAVRVHVTGSAHPDASVYRALEEHGMVVVSEDHDTGDEAWLGACVVSDDVESVNGGLIRQHFGRIAGSATCSIASRAALTTASAIRSGARIVLSLIREGDEAPAWDLAVMSEELAAAGIRLVSRRWISHGDAVRHLADVAREIHDERVAS